MTINEDPLKKIVTLGRQALGRVSPNPAVGAVVLQDGKVVGQGYTQPPGGPHAEVMALREAGDKAKGSKLYVSLEPCPHHGRTPPCTEAIIASGVEEVFVSVLDPNPNVAGRGKKVLESAGIKVRIGAKGSKVVQESNLLIEAYAKYITTGVPFVTVKFAASLDGKVATTTGKSRWISDKDSLELTHGLRSEADAVMVGIGTALKDDPRLTVRLKEHVDRQPVRIVVDSQGRLPSDAAMLAEEGLTILATTEKPIDGMATAPSPTVEVMKIPGSGQMVDLPKLMRQLGDRGISSILVEGGGTLVGGLFDRGLVDKVIAFIAPIIIGGATAPSAVEGQGIDLIAHSWSLRDSRYELLSKDIMVTGYPVKEE